MNLFQFLNLDIDAKASLVWQGKLVASRTENEAQVLLYNLGDYYAEVFYDTLKNEIIEIRGFRARSMLLPYLITPNE